MGGGGESIERLDPPISGSAAADERPESTPPSNWSRTESRCAPFDGRARLIGVQLADGDCTEERMFLVGPGTSYWPAGFASCLRFRTRPAACHQKLLTRQAHHLLQEQRQRLGRAEGSAWGSPLRTSPRPGAAIRDWSAGAGLDC